LLVNGVSGRVPIQRTIKKNGEEARETHWYSRVGALKALGNAVVPQIPEVIGRAILEYEAGTV
jgi:site-specific DNA-cytosine methylase